MTTTDSHLHNKFTKRRARHRWWASCLSLAMLLSMPAAFAQANLNLGSNSKTSVAPQAGVIREAGHTKVVQAGDLLTAGELTALLQGLHSGRQSLILNGQGTAIGGRFNVATDLQNSIGSLAIPKNVTALDNVALGAVFDVNGALTNAGRVYAYSSDLQSRQAIINVGSLLNQASGTISSITPRLAGVRSLVSQLDLTLNSGGDFINKGMISSSGNLNIAADNVINSGTLKSVKGNVNFVSPGAVNFVLDNTGGSITALKGNINVRDASYSHKNDATIAGGDFNAKAFNFYTGDGTLTVNVEKMIGRVNINAGIAHVNASTAKLDLGNIYLTGDPTFYNTGGDVLLNGSIITPGQNIAIVAGGDIISGTAGAIDTSVSNGNAGSITLVAGAQFTSDAGANTNTYSTGSHNFVGNSTDTLTITNGSVIGGKIDLTQGTGVTSVNASSGNGNAGNVTMVAFGGTNTGSGTVLLPSNGTVTANATNGQAGQINLLAGGTTSGTAIQAGTVSAAVSNSGGPGTVQIVNAAPSIAGNVTILDGQITTGSFSPGTTILNGSVSTGPISAPGGVVAVEAGHNLSVPSIDVTPSLPNSNGGTLVAASKSSTQMVVGATGTNYVGSIHGTNAVGNGNGGFLVLVNTGSGGINVNNTTGNAALTANGSGNAPGAGYGGLVLVDSTVNGGTGSLNFVNPVVQARGSNNNGGQITINSTGFITNNAFLNADASVASGAGDGGSVSISVSSNGADINSWTVGANQVGGNVNAGPSGGNGGNFSLSAGRDLVLILAGTSTWNPAISGNGGNVTLNAGRNLTNYNGYAVSANGVGNGSGGNITMTAGSAVAITGGVFASGAGSGGGGVITLTGQTVNNSKQTWANGGGSGPGGIVTINTNSIYPFTMSTSGTPPNGVLSSISVTGTNGGSISIFNKGSGGITVANQLLLAAPVVSGNGGTILLDAVSNGGTGSIVLGSPTSSVIINVSGSGVGNGGSITLKGTSVINPSPFVSGLFANGGTTGNGGSLTITSTDAGSDVILASITGGLALAAKGGTTSGNGGSISVTSARNIVTFTQAAAYNAQPLGSGDGGDYSFTAANNVQIFGGVNANALGTGNGGSIVISSHSSSAFLVNQTGLNYVSGVLSANAVGNGNGGSISISNGGAGGISYSNATGDISANASGNGSGGAITLDALAGGTGGALTIGSGFSINTSASGIGTQGGSIVLKGNTLNLGASGVNLTANGNTVGAGGSIYVQTTNSSSDLTVGTNNLVISALGGTTSGQGGTVSVLAGRDLTVNTGSLSYSPTSGSGANLTFTAGRNLVVSSGLSGSAVGTGDGGSVSLSSNSSTVFTINGSTTNSINGLVSATAAGAGNQGSISIINLGSGGITSSGGITLNASAAGAGATKLGSITLQGASISSLMTLQINGGTTGDGGIINVTSSSNSADVTVDASNLILSANATNGSGGQINITSGRDLFFTPTNGQANAAGTGNGGTYNLVAGRNLAINGSLTASGSTNGNGGSILIKMNSSAPFIIGQNSGNSVNGTLTANGAGIGNGGTVSITNLGSGGIADNVGANKINVMPLGTGNGGNITFDAAKSGGTGPLYLGLPNVQFTLNASSSTGNGGTITLSGSDLLPGILGYNLNVASTMVGGTGGTISITTTGTTSDVKLGGADSIGADIHGTQNAGTLNVTAGRDIIINGPVDGSGSNGINWFGPQPGNGGTFNLTAGTKATAGNVIINPTLFIYSYGTGDGGKLNITFKDPTGQVNVGITGSGTSIGGGVTATGSNGGAPGSVTINNVAAGGGINMLIQQPGGISTSSSGPSGFTYGTTNLVANNGPVTVVCGAGLSTAFTVSGATSFNMSATGSGGLDFTYGNVQANGAITITNNNNASSSITLMPGSTFTSNNHDIQLTAQYINNNTTISSGGGNITIYPRYLTNNGTVNAGGGVINVAPGGDLYVDGLGAWITSGANKGIIFAAVNSALTFRGSQTYSDNNGPYVSFAGLSVSTNPGTDQAVITNTTYDVGISYGTSSPVALNISMGPYSRFNGVGVTTASMFIYSANAGGPATLNINVPDSTYATWNTNGGAIVIHTVIPANSTGPVNFACPSCTGTGTLLLNGGNVTISSDDKVTIGTNTILSSDHTITIDTPNLTINGGIQTTASGNSITLANVTANTAFTLVGTGTISQLGTGTTTINSPDLLLLNGVNLQFIGSNVALINAPGISSITTASSLDAASGLKFATTGTLTVSSPSLSSLTVSSSNGDLVFNTNINASNITLSAPNGAMNGTGTLTATSTLSLTGGTGSISLNTNVANLTGSTSGALTLQNTGAITVNGLNGGDVLINATSFTNTGAINVNTLTVGATTFTNNSAIFALTSVSVSSAFTPLTISGTGTISSGVSNNFLSGTGALTFAGSQTLLGPTNLNALYFGQSVVINSGVTVSCDSDVYVNSPTLTLNGNLIGNVIHFNSVVGAGTIANSTGDITLPKTLVFSGQNLAILAAGNVIAPTGLTAIKLSSATGKAGSLTIVAGYQLGPTPSPSAPSLSNQFFTLLGPSTTGGSIIMPKTAIDTSSKGVGTAAGNVILIASKGTANSGMISVGGITTSAGTGVGGSVRIVAGGGIQVNGAIVTKGGNAGSVTLIGAQPQIVGGQVSFVNGLKYGSGTFTGTPTPGTGAAILVTGGITSSATTGRGGDVTLQSDAGIELDKGIVTSGISTPVLGVSASGNVNISSLLSVFVGTGGINTSATGVTSGNAGDGGQILVVGNSAITIKGNVLSTGGSTKAGGTAGKGGTIVLATSSNNPNSVFIGNTAVTGYIDSRGGNSPTTGGAGGNISILSGTMQISGVKSGVSINASGGTGGVTGNGIVNLQTYSVQSLPANFDLLSTTKSVVALPGGMFTIGKASPVNGTAGSIVSGTASVASKASVNGGTGRIVSTNGVTLPKVSITVVGGAISVVGLANPVTPDNGSGTRTMVTPAQAVALFQKSEGNPQGMNFNSNGQAVSGSTVTVDQVELPAAFTAFKLQAADSPTTNIHLLVTGLSPVVTLPKTNVLLGGEINFVTPGSTAMVDFSTASVTLLAGAAIRATNTSTLILSGNGSTWTNNGTIEADKIEIARTVASPLSLVVGSAGTIQGAAGALNAAIDLSPDFMSAYAVNFKSNGGTFNLPVEFGNLFAPTLYKSLATANASSYTKLKPAALTFALTGPGNVATTANLQGTALRTSTISILSTANKIGTTTTLTPLALANNTNLAASTKLIISSVGGLTIGNNVHLTAGVLKSSAPSSGLIAATDIVTAGSITITNTGAAGITIGNSDAFVVTGGNLAITSTLGNITFGNNGEYQSNGGRIQILALGQVLGGTTNDFYARAASSGPAATGGGMEIGSGLVKSTLLNSAFSMPKNTNPPSGVLGVGVVINNNGGVVLGNYSSGGAFFLSGSTLTLNKGAVVFDATGFGSTVVCSGCTFRTDALKPIAARTVEYSEQDVIVDAEDDEAPNL